MIQSEFVNVHHMPAAAVTWTFDNFGATAAWPVWADGQTYATGGMSLLFSNAAFDGNTAGVHSAPASLGQGNFVRPIVLTGVNGGSFYIQSMYLTISKGNTPSCSRDTVVEGTVVGTGEVLSRTVALTCTPTQFDFTQLPADWSTNALSKVAFRFADNGLSSVQHWIHVDDLVLVPAASGSK